MPRAYLLALACALIPSSALATRARLAIVLEPSGEVARAPGHEEIADAAAYYLDLAVVEPEVLARAMIGDACAGDPLCRAERLAKTADLALWVTPDLELPLTRYRLELVDAATGATRALHEIDLSPPRPRREMIRRAVWALLTEAGHRLAGRLRVETAPPEALVVVEWAGRQVAMRPGHVTLPPGRFRVRAAKEGYEPAAVEVDVEAGELNEIFVNLGPSFTPAHDEAAAFSLGMFSVGIGLVVVGIGAVLAASFSGGDDPTEPGRFCHSVDPGRCP